MPKTLIFLHNRLYILSSHGKKVSALHGKCFSKDSLVTTFSLFLKASEVCIIFKKKCWLPNKSANKIFLHKTTYTPPLLWKKILRSPSQILLETSTFYHIFLIFIVDERFHISNKYQPSSNLAENQCFYTRNILSLLHFHKNRFSPSQAFFKTSSFYVIW